jgi:hypothetical protein
LTNRTSLAKRVSFMQKARAVSYQLSAIRGIQFWVRAGR